MLKVNEVYLGDCIQVMKDVDSESIDMILTDLPYNVTKNKWDQQVIPLDLLWNEYKRIIKKNGAILLFAQGIFAAKLIMSNEKWYKYDLIWKKGERVSGFLNSKKQFMRNHEQILLFYNKQVNYFPIMSENGRPLHSKGKKYLNKEGINNNYGYYDTTLPETRKGSTQKYPKSVLNFEKPHPAIHPNEKPLLLLEYLIKTFTNENEIVLDSTCGSGSTCVAAKNTNRKYIGIEIDQKWVDLAKQRLK
jgi:site-specific DNA-methyltransferase (adenine-specific)